MATGVLPLRVATPLRQRKFAPWLVAAAMLHCGVWAVWRARPPKTAAPVAATAPSAPFEISIEVPEAVPPIAPRPSVEATRDAPVSPNSVVASALGPAAAAHREVSGKPRASGSGAGPAPQTTARSQATPTPPVDDARAVNDARAVDGASSSPAVPGAENALAAKLTPLDGAGAEPGESSDAVAANTPTRSPNRDVEPSQRLAELGYGAPNAAALQPYLDVKPLAAAQERLDQHLAQAILDHDRDHSLGIEGPVTNALHTAAMGVVVPKSLSKVIITIGRDGKLADFRILETDHNARALAALGERVRHLLASQTVKVPPGRAVEFIYEVRSEVQLPSGRAPGLAVEVAGIPVKKGRDKKSSKISILTPVLKFESQSQADPERNGKVTQTLPQLVYGISLLGLDADAVDLLANERQVVHTRLIQQRVL